MYKCYIKKKTKRGGEVLTDTRTSTPSAAAVEIAYRELLGRDDLLGKPFAAILSLDSKALMYYAYDEGKAPPKIIKIQHE